MGEFGIVANVCEPDRVFRMGAKAWLVGFATGDGSERYEWLAMTRSGKRVRKWTTTARFDNFRAKWIPEHLRDEFSTFSGTKDDMARQAEALEQFANTYRATHKNRPNAEWMAPTG